MIHVSKRTLIYWSELHKEEIENKHNLELEALYEKYFMLKGQRIQSFGDMLLKIKDAMEKKFKADELSTVPIEKLVIMFEHYATLLKDEYYHTPRSSTKIIAFITDREQSRSSY